MRHGPMRPPPCYPTWETVDFLARRPSTRRRKTAATTNEPDRSCQSASFETRPREGPLLRTSGWKGSQPSFNSQHSTVRPEEPPSLWRRLEGRDPSTYRGFIGPQHQLRADRVLGVNGSDASCSRPFSVRPSRPRLLSGRIEGRFAFIDTLLAKMGRTLRAQWRDHRWLTRRGARKPLSRFGAELMRQSRRSFDPLAVTVLSSARLC